MVRFTYTAITPSTQQETKLYELTFAEYKQLLKLILNDNNTYIVSAFNDVINNLCCDKQYNLTFLDKIVLLLTIRSVCIFPTLELTFTQPGNKQGYNLTFEISEIVKRINDSSLFKTFNNNTITYENFEVTYGIPSELFYTSEEDLIYSTLKEIKFKNKNKTYDNVTEFKKDIFDKLPAFILKDAKEHVKQVEEEISKLTLLSVKTPQEQAGIVITPSIFSNSSLEFLKLCYKRDLISMYELEYFLLSKLKLSHEVVMNSTYAELMTYIGFYNEEKARQEKAEQKQFTNPLAASR
jgi:hypothetical protein